MLMRIQAQILINEFNDLSINQEVQMAAPVLNYVLSPFEGKIYPGDLQRLKCYTKSTNDIYKETDKLDISV